MSAWRRRLRDWWRGYSDSEMEAVIEKCATAAVTLGPGAVILLTRGEMRALLSTGLSWTEIAERANRPV